jgi:HEAT repeat protein
MNTVGPCRSSWCLFVLVVSLSLLLSASCGSKLPKLREQLNDPDPQVKITALKALAEAKDTVAVPRMVELLADTVPDVRKESARALGKIGDERACQPLADFYDQEQIQDVQDAGIRALLVIGTPSIGPLVGLLRSIRSPVKAGAARALGKLKAMDAVDPLIWLIRDRDPDVRMASIMALRQIGDKRGMEAIAGAVRDADPDVELEAEKALSGAGYEEQLNKAKRVARQLPYP